MDNKESTPLKRRRSTKRFNIKEQKNKNTDNKTKDHISWSVHESMDQKINDQKKQKPTHYKRIGSLKKLKSYNKYITEEDKIQNVSILKRDQQLQQSGISKVQDKKKEQNKIKRIGTLKKILAVIYDDNKEDNKLVQSLEKEKQTKIVSKKEIVEDKSIEEIRQREKQEVISKEQGKKQQNRNLNVIAEQMTSTVSKSQDYLKIDEDKNNNGNNEDVVKQNMEELYNNYIIQVLSPNQRKEIQEEEEMQYQPQSQQEQQLEQSQDYNRFNGRSYQIDLHKQESEKDHFDVSCLLKLPQINQLLNGCRDQQPSNNQRTSKNSQASVLTQSVHAETCPERELNNTIKTISEEETKQFTPLGQKKNEVKITLKKKKFEERKNSQPFLTAPKKTNSNFNVKKKNFLNQKKENQNIISNNLVQSGNKEKNSSLILSPPSLNTVNAHYVNSIVKVTLDKAVEKQNNKEGQNDDKNFRKKRLENASIHSYIAEAKKQISYLK